MFKNVASQYWVVFAFDETDNTPVTGDAANITAKISKDAAAGVATNDTNPTELEDGYYYFALTQAETNADMLLILPESSTADVQVIGQPPAIFTNPPYFNALGIESDGDLTKVNTLNGHTPQTGDTYGELPANFSLIGVEADGHVHSDVKEIEGSDATDQIRDSVVDDATRLDGSALNTLAGQIENIVGRPHPVRRMRAVGHIHERYVRQPLLGRIQNGQPTQSTVKNAYRHDRRAFRGSGSGPAPRFEFITEIELLIRVWRKLIRGFSQEIHHRFAVLGKRFEH